MAQPLLTQGNSLPPIFCLPPEILAEIFTHGARHHHESTVGTSFRVPNWVNVSRVCRFWRAIALSHPTLWSYHFIVSPRWTHELLARSKQAPLKIRIYCNHMRPESWWMTLVQLLLAKPERIQEFYLGMEAVSFQTTLSLVSGSQTQDILPSTRRDRSSLRTLGLTGCPLRWNSFDLSGVTALYLCHVPTAFQLGIEEFLTTLRGMEALAVLHLEHALPIAHDFLGSAAFDTFPKINLARLDRLFILGSLSTVVALLSCVNIPAATTVLLEVTVCDSSSIGDYANFPSILARRFRQAEDSPIPTIRSFTLDHSRYESIIFSASEHSDWAPHNLSTEQPTRDYSVYFRIYLEMFEDPVAVDWDRFVSDICCVIPSTQVESLHVVNPPFSAAFWRQTLGHPNLAGLRYMKLSDGFMPDLVPVLTFPPHPAETLSGRLPTMFVPALEQLELQRIAFAPEDDVGIVSQESLDHAILSRGDHRPEVAMIECMFGEDLDIEDDDMEMDSAYTTFLDEMAQ